MKKKHLHAHVPPAEDTVIVKDGHVLALSPDDAKKLAAVNATGRVLAVILETDDSLAMHVMGEPSQALADALTQIAESYQQAVRGH